MNKLLTAVVLSCIFLTGCETRTEYGECVGLGEDQNPTLHYKVSAQNVVVGILFSEMIAPPAVVLLSETYCPVGPAYKQP